VKLRTLAIVVFSVGLVVGLIVLQLLLNALTGKP
jgi:hypothetical protein